MRKRLSVVVKLAVSIGLIGLIYRRMPISELKASFAVLQPAWLPLIFGLLLFNTLLSAWKWQMLLRADSIHVPLPQLFGSYWVGTFFNLFMPSSIGGDAYRVYDVARLSANAASSFSSVLADRLSGFVALAAIALLASIGVGRLTGQAALVLLPLLALFGLAMAVAALYWQAPARRLLRAVGDGRWRTPAAFATRCLDSFLQYRDRPRLIWNIMGVAFLFQCSLIVCVYLMAIALGLRVPLVYFCAFVPMICLLEALPLSIYGIGIRDAGYVFFFGLVGVGQVATRSLALLVLGTNVAYSLLGGGVLVFRLFRPGAAAGSASRIRLTGAAIAGLSLLATLLVWGLFSWPLPRHLFDGIPSSSRNTEMHQNRSMIAGDHLQLLYHFWLADDMMRGRTPPFMNLYEFNTGDDGARREPGAYYAPFSLVYAVLVPLGGRAFGWNMTGLFSLFLTLYLTWRLVRRYVDDDGIAGPAALLSVIVPYRWIMLLGGSPTGFAMALVPLLLLGLDAAVREDRPAGGAVAGLAMIMAFGSDLHVFFFSALIAPAWCLVALAARDDFEWTRVRAWLRLAGALLPAVALAGVAFLLSRLAARELAGATLAEGWTIKEIAPYSPARQGILAWTSLGLSNQVFVGYAMLASLAVALLHRLMAAGCAWRREWRRLLVLTLLLAGAAGVLALALGVNGPGSGRPIIACRKVLPPYAMIRQTGKIFCLMPSLLAAAVAVGLGGKRVLGRKATRAILLAGVIATLLECRMQISATVCRLDPQQGAYAAVATEAAETGIPARALVLPLWPGDSHWSSLYQYYTSLYRIRLVNGYRPAVPQDYGDDIFRRYESLNQGVADEALLNDLLKRGVNHMLLHEDAFPEQVSPFPVGLTLQRLLRHPRLDLLTQDGAVWAFRIRADAKPSAPTDILMPWLSSARHWEGERMVASALRQTDATASGGQFARLAQDGDSLSLATRAPIANAEHLRLLMRVRGDGALRGAIDIDGRASDTLILPVQTAGWNWQALPVTTEEPFFKLKVTLSPANGTIDLDSVMLAAGPWTGLQPGEAIEWPAASFFHAGYTVRETGGVRLRRDRDPAGAILYATLMPLEAGEYEAVLRAQAEAPANTFLGSFRMTAPDGTTESADVRQGQPTAIRFPSSGLPIRIECSFARSCDMEVAGVTLRRVK